MENNDDFLTLNQLAEMVGVSRRTVSDWCSPKKRHISRRLRVIRYGHKTVRVRRSDWEKFKQQLSN
jgi:predicted DNA-binding transcriptional regulator AlpA